MLNLQFSKLWIIILEWWQKEFARTQNVYTIKKNVKTGSHGRMIQKQSQKASVKLISNLIKTKIIAGH